MDEDAGGRRPGEKRWERQEVEEHRSKDWISGKAQFLMRRKHSPTMVETQNEWGELARKSPLKPRHAPDSDNPGSLACRDLQCFLFSSLVLIAK